LQELAEKASKRIGIKGRIINWNQAEPCMDVDKPHQLEIMREDLEFQKQKEAAAKKRALRASAKKLTSPKPKAVTQVKAKAKPK
jgi:hypothetical protein